MPARRVFAWEPEEQWTSSEEREKKIEELSRELDESMDSNSGKGCLKAYLVKNEVWHIADIDYELRVDYRKYLKSTYSDSCNQKACQYVKRKAGDSKEYRFNPRTALFTISPKSGNRRKI